ncbi:YdeI/OmpD-associated family protein [Paenibacillus flagellatus]|nr:YdeI/OmpD-associated family protein [Paenibacillus flagellatus]
MRPFEAVLIRPEGTGTWTYVKVPFSVEQAYGTKGQFKVKGTVNGVPLRGSLMPNGDGTHYLVVNRSVREEAGVTAGDVVRVELEADLDERTVDVPGDLLAALDANEAAAAFFVKLSYSHRKEYVEWIVSAKKDETRIRRIGQAIEMMAQGRKAK